MGLAEGELNQGTVLLPTPPIHRPSSTGGLDCHCTRHIQAFQASAPFQRLAVPDLSVRASATVVELSVLNDRTMAETTPAIPAAV